MIDPPAEQPSSPWRAKVLARRGAVALLVAAATLGGWLAGQRAQGDDRLTITGHVSGTVSVVNQTGAKLCITPAGGGQDRGASIYRRPDASPIGVGDDVEVGIGRLRTDADEWLEIFVLEPPGK